MTILFGVVSQASAQPKWSRTRLTQEVADAAKFYHLSTTQTRWIKRAALDVVFDGSYWESSGGWYSGEYGACKGIFQFNGGWSQTKAIARLAKREHHKHHNGNWRLCAHCSTYRFVKSYKDGGRNAIRKHWGATLEIY